ncbi:MAG: hypothetical protein ACKORD_05485 [Acidimicrobiaceae bacterium]
MSILMSLTVIDVTVRSSAIIVLSMIAFWFANRGRTKGQNKPLVVRVDNKQTNYYQSLTKDQTLRSAGFLGLGTLAMGIFTAVIVSVVVAFIFSTLTSSLGN